MLRIILVSILLVQIKNYLTDTALDQVEKVKDYIVEKVDELQVVHKVNSIVEVEKSDVMGKLTSIKEYLNNLNK